MFIKYLDYLSPRVTFYYKGYLSHASILSGILSIIAITFIIILAVYFSLDLIQRNDPNTFYFKSFTEDAGLYKVNSSSLFHFVSIVKNIRGISSNEMFDFTYFNIIGAQSYYENYLSNQKRGLKSFEHWLYGYCDKKTNTEGIDDLINYNFFEKSACIKKYYNKNFTKYYDIGDNNFEWPEIAYGTFNEQNKLYGLFLQKCNNDTIKEILGEDYQCKTDEEIEKYFNIQGSRIIHLYFINNYINVLNYENPNNKFFYRIENPFTKDQYASNDINFNPTLVRSHNGLVFDNVRDDISYMFDRNDVYIGSNEGKNIYLAYNFFLKNIMEYYERTYKRIQEVISSIGGINQVITIIAIYLNYIYNNYVVLSDTEILLHSSISNEKYIHKKKSNEYKDLKKKMKDLEKPKINNNNEINNDNNIENNKIAKSKKYNEKEKKHYNTNYLNEDNDMSKSNNNIFNKDPKKNYTDLEKDINEFKNNDKKDTNNNDKEDVEYKSKNNNFWNYLIYAITFKNRKKLFKVYEDFRIKIISEEHLIRNHLNIYNLMKVTEKKRHNRRNSYQLKDLIKLV